MEFRDLKSQYEKYKEQINTGIQSVIENTTFIGGSYVDLLEKRLARYVGVNYCITCANGTDALALVLKAWGVGVGDAVFVPNFTFFASAEVVSLVGATPVFVDVYADTFNIDTADLKQKIEKVNEEGGLNPKVIMPVDLFGLLADYKTINNIAKEYGLLVLEDGAQGFGAEYKGRKACSFGDAATTSFFPAKPLGCYGDGGAIFTNNDELADLLKSLRVHGKGKNKYDNIRIGQNSRLDTIQAAVLNVKLDAFIEHELEDVNTIYKLYNKKLSNYVTVPTIPVGYKSSFAQYTIKLDSKELRDGLKLFLMQNDIPSMIYYVKGMHNQAAFSDLGYVDKDFPVTTNLCDTVLSLPMHPYLSKKDIEFISNKVLEFIVNS